MKYIYCYSLLSLLNSWEYLENGTLKSKFTAKSLPEQLFSYSELSNDYSLTDSTLIVH